MSDCEICDFIGPDPTDIETWQRETHRALHDIARTVGQSMEDFLAGVIHGAEFIANRIGMRA